MTVRYRLVAVDEDAEGPRRPISAKALRTIADWLDTLDPIALNHFEQLHKGGFVDAPTIARMRSTLRATELQDDVRRWADSLESDRDDDGLTLEQAKLAAEVAIADARPATAAEALDALLARPHLLANLALAAGALVRYGADCADCEGSFTSNDRCDNCRGSNFIAVFARPAEVEAKRWW